MEMIEKNCGCVVIEVDKSCDKVFVIRECHPCEYENEYGMSEVSREHFRNEYSDVVFNKDQIRSIFKHIGTLISDGYKLRDIEMSLGIRG